MGTSRIFIMTLIWLILGGVAVSFALITDILIAVYAVRKTDDFGWANWIVYITNTDFEHVWLPMQKCTNCLSYTDVTFKEWEEEQEEEETRLNREIRRCKGD